jgi:hypothetical protein
MKDTITLSLEIPQQIVIVRALINRVEKLFTIRHDMNGKLDKWTANEIRSAIKLVRLARKAHEMKFSL